MKSTLKKVLPNSLINGYKKYAIRKELKDFKKRDMNRFWESASLTEKADSYDQIASRIIYSVHAIEKGMTHSGDELRLGFGKTVFQNLYNDMKLYKEKKYDENDYVYQMAVSAILEYRKFHEAYNYDIHERISCFSELIPVDFINEISSVSSGVLEISIEDKALNRSKDFKQLSEERHSVRTYSDETVDIKLVYEAIELSMKTPSVCNRQGWKVYIITNNKTIKELLTLQGGLNGYPIPPVLVLVTGNNQVYLRSPERNQSYVDGGMFSMSLLYSLEYVGLAACALSTNQTIDREDGIRRLANIKETEDLIMFISIGNFAESNVVPKSTRKDAQKIINVLS